MNFVFSLFDSRFVPYTQALNPAEIIVYPYRFSKYGKILPEQLVECVRTLKKSRHRVTVCVDIMLREKHLSTLRTFFDHPVFQMADAFRFLDPGVGRLYRKQFPDAPIQQNFERHSLNSHAIKSWCRIFQPMQERLILSSQLPLDAVDECMFDGCPETELLGIGPIEIFYSARNLLNPQSDAFFEERNIKNNERPGTLSSKIIQTVSGTVLFYERMLYTMDMLPEIRDAGVGFVRFDFWGVAEWELYLSCRLPGNGVDNNQKTRWGKTTRAFIKANKTDAQFKRLTNIHLRTTDEKNGRVLQHSKNNYLAVELFENIALPSTIQFFTPEGKDIRIVWEQLKTCDGEYVKDAVPGVYLAPWTKHAVSGSRITFIRDTE